MPSPISVLVVDDSAFMRKMVSEMIAEDPGLCVVGQARDGEDALRKLTLLRPDVVTLDVEMPVLDGLASLEQIMRIQPTPTIMLSSLTQAGAETTLKCLERGAVDFIGKPSGSISLDVRLIAAELIAKIKAAAGVRLSHLSPKRPPPAPPRRSAPMSAPSTQSQGRTGGQKGTEILVIGASTGGPRALQTLVPALPADLHMPIVIVQHMPIGFTTSLASRLADASPFPVREAGNGDVMEPGVALVAPGGHHLQFDALGRVHLSDEPPVHGVRPSIDVTLASLARFYGAKTIAVLLTGMGKDGARGLKTVRDLGGTTFAEDETTCVVYGMPKAAVEIGAVQHLLPLPQIVESLKRLFAESGKH